MYYYWEKQAVDWEQGVQLHAPDGFRLHSWHPGGSAVLWVCWEQLP